MNDRTIKFIDATIGRLTVKLMGMGRGRNARPIPSWNLDDHSEFLLIRPGGIGDAALLAPLIRWLSDHGKTVDILCMQRNAGVFSILRSRGMIRHINHLDSPSDMIRLIRHHRYDVILDTEQSFYLSAVASRFIRRSIIIGFDTNERRNLYDAFVRYSQEDYEAESFMRLLEPFGIQERPIFTPVSRSRGNTLAVFAGASHPGRLWPPDHWREVLDRIGDRFDEVILIGGPAEKELNDKIAKAYRHKNLRNEAGNLTLGGTLEVLESVSHLLSTDS
ncbi:MAG TPA: glycosyltransferase family 9 protein [bacterium]|nr:glycosyltransferase family 9 protein [bacterium]